MLTIGIPTYKNSDIVWLQLESLCRQVDAPSWELVMVEELSDKFFGEKELLKFKAKLFKAGCVGIKYVLLDEWIPLSKKWLVIRDNMNKDSIGMLLCASDNYSPSWRLCETYKAFKDGAEWYQSKSGYFFNLLTHEAAMFDMINENAPSLFMAISKDKLMSVRPNDFPRKGVDTWLMKSAKITNLVQVEFAEGGVHTDGFNTISHNRRLLYKSPSSPLFTEVNGGEVFKLFPKDIQIKLLKIKKMAEAKKKQAMKVEASKKVYPSGDVVKFKSNGKSKHLDKDAVFTLDGDKANLFLQLGYGEVID